MKHFFFTALLFIFTSFPSFGISIAWDGGGDNITWTNALNWDCNCLPGSNDVVTILNAAGATVIIPTGANVHIYRLNSFQNVTIQTGASLQSDYYINLLFNSNFINNGTINAYGEGIYATDSTQVTNNGFINIEGSDNFLTLNGSYPSKPVTFTNNGSIVFNNVNLSILETRGSSVFNNSVTGHITFNYATALLNVVAGTFNNHGTIDTKGKIINSSNFINTNTGNILVHDYIQYAINNGGMLTNNGDIIVGSPTSSALHCLNNSGTFNSSGSIDFSALNLIYNTGTCTIGGPADLTGQQQFGGIYNSGSLIFANPDWVLDITTKIWNTAIGSLTINSCKKLKSTGHIQNEGTINNNGYLDLTGSGAYAYSSTGSFFNTGVFSSSFDVAISAPVGNPGFSVDKIFGQQCAGSSIVFFYLGSLTGIANNPSGIFTTSDLSTSAGSFDYLTRTFIPNAACHNLTTLYISLQRSGCNAEVVPIRFELPIYAPTTYYEDADFDGYGNLAVSQIVACGPSPLGYVTNSTDCDDTNADVHPGAPETCNDKDYNCDGMITGTNPAPTWYKDADFDGYGNPSISIVNCNPVFGYVGTNNDCNDADGQIHPLALEQCNNIDDDCDGLIDEDFPPVLLTFNGSVSNDWFTAANWTPAIVPSYCVDVFIPTLKTVMISSGVANCRSINIDALSTLNFSGGTLNITGGTSFGINNHGILNITGSANCSIKNIIGNGLQNSSNVNINDNASLYLNVISTSCIQNNPSSTITINGPNVYLDMSSSSHAISNAGTFHRNGYTNINQISGSAIFNSGTFNNNGDMYANAFGLPDWYIENTAGSTFNNLGLSVIAFPIPGAFYNVSNKGLINHTGATFHNYGELRFFGHRISGGGALIMHVGSTMIGCSGLGCF